MQYFSVSDVIDLVRDVINSLSDIINRFITSPTAKHRQAGAEPPPPADPGTGEVGCSSTFSGFRGMGVGRTATFSGV